MPTVNDLLDPGRVLELVKRWKSTVAGFVTREKEHVDQRNERRITLRRAYDKREEQAKGELGMRLAELGQAQEAERQHVAAEYAQRQQRIADALRGSRGQLATRVQYRRDSLVGQAQAGILRNKEEAKREMARRRPFYPAAPTVFPVKICVGILQTDRGRSARLEFQLCVHAAAIPVDEIGSNDRRTGACGSSR